MNGLYQIFLFLFIFGAVTQGINEMAVFPTKMVSINTSISGATVTDLQSGALSQPANDFNIWSVVSSFMRVIGMGLTSLVTVVPVVWTICVNAGCDPTLAAIMAGLLQAPLTIVTLFGLFEWWTGRQIT
jgi:hypothetical protein